MQEKIVYRIDDNINRQDVLCTTYQMRNFYTQFKDGFFTNLDVMNYIQHYAVAKMAKKGMNIVDVCCGRSLMLPLLRYYAKDIISYTGIDISKSNLKEAMKGASKKLTLDELKTYYPFKVKWILKNVAQMSDVIPKEFANLIIYTSALEHMHKDTGAKSLRECYKILNKNGIMFLSCPNTNGNGYNTQYRAHVYEWGYNELKKELNNIGFKIIKEVGLVMGAKEMNECYQNQPEPIRQYFNKMKEYLPTAWLTAIAGIPFPKASKEILFICTKG